MVILDANILIGDYRLRRSSSQSLLEGAKTGVFDLGVPSVALREAVRDYGRVTTELKTANKKAAELERRLGLPSQPKIDVAQLQSEYEDWLRNTITDNRGEILDAPSVEHDVLLSWDFETRKPFKANGTGYRDALIWCTAVDNSMTRPVYLVTDNWKDFASDKAGDKLAPPLQGDVDAVSGDLRLFRSLFDVLAVIAPADDLVALLEQDFADETGPYEQLVSRIEASYDRLDASNVEVGGLEDVDEIFPEYLEIVTIQVVNASHRGEGRYVVELEVEANVDLYASGYTEVEEDDEDDFGGWITRYRYRLVSRTKSATVSFAVDCEYDRPSEEFVDLTLGVARGRVEF